MRRGLLAALAVLVAVAFAAWLWLASLFTEPNASTVDSLAGALGAQRVLGVFAHPDDEQLVTGLLLFLCSEDASYITGQVITVNGGMC